MNPNDNPFFEVPSGELHREHGYRVGHGPTPINGAPPMGTERILMYTPTLDKRIKNPFLEPCRQSRFAMKGIAERLESHTVPLGTAYQDAHKYALAKGYPWVLLVVDDELLPPMSALEFLSISKATNSKLLVAVKRLRNRYKITHTPGIYSPCTWIYEQTDATGNHPVNARILRVEQVHPNKLVPWKKVTGGTICTPIFYSPQWFEDKGLEFHGQYASPYMSKIPLGAWDTNLADDLARKWISFIACPTIHAKHYDVDGPIVLE